MADWFLETGLYLLGIALIPAIGLLLVCWGLWGDRSKGRSRCPKCWYDMRGSLPRLECPECGHDAKQERRLYKNRRRWRPVVLGVLLVLLFSYPLTIVGGWCREQSVIQKLPKVGYSPPATVRTGPDWLVDRLSEYFARPFDRVVVVRIHAATDADLAECGKLRRLQELQIDSSPKVTDAGLAHLSELSQLQHLYLFDTQVTDAGLVHLRGLSRLSHLILQDAQVTGSGLVHLTGLSDLRQLQLVGPHVGNAELIHLEGLSHVEYLTLGGEQVTDVGLSHLKGLSQLRSLMLYCPRATNAGSDELMRALPNARVEDRAHHPPPAIP